MVGFALPNSSTSCSFTASLKYGELRVLYAVAPLSFPTIDFGFLPMMGSCAEKRSGGGESDTKGEGDERAPVSQRNERCRGVSTLRTVPKHGDVADSKRAVKGGRARQIILVPFGCTSCGQP